MTFISFNVYTIKVFISSKDRGKAAVHLFFANICIGCSIQLDEAEAYVVSYVGIRNLIRRIIGGVHLYKTSQDITCIL